MTDKRAFASFASSCEAVRAFCTRCGNECPPDTMACPSCGTALSGETVLDNIHAVETILLDARGEAGARTHNDTTIDNQAFASAPPSTPLASVERTDEEVDTQTKRVSRRPSVSDPLPTSGSSSDPPTRFLRGFEQHIELPSGSMVDDYEVDAKLGAGAMGEVYAARHVKLGKRVAIKVISPRLSEDAAAVERFAQEARTLAQMHHPGLVDVLGFGELADGRAYFVMEYLSGESLFDRLQRGRLDQNEAIDIFSQIARALEAAHTHGVVHRDLKPENIFLAQVTNEQRPIVRLLDFGLARLEVEVDRRAERTQSGVAIGTPMYLSPEQARGPDVDGRTDIYALGCVAYEMFLGHHPFHDARTVAALIAAHMHDVPPMPRSFELTIPPALDLLLFAMLAKAPAHRPTLPQVRSVVEGVRAPPTVRAETAPLAPRSTHRRTVAIAVIAMLAGIVIGAAAIGSRSDDRPAPAALPNTNDAAALMPTDTVDAGIDAAAISPVAIDAGTAQPRVAVRPQSRPVVTDAHVDAGSLSVSEDQPLDAALLDTVDADPIAAVPIRPTAPVRGFLKIIAPRGAAVLVDGASPVGALSKLPLPPGKHRVQFVVGLNKDAFSVVIQSGQLVTLDKHDLYPPGPASGDLNRTVNPFEKKPPTR